MGAWIEITCISIWYKRTWSHPTWVRWLKWDDKKLVLDKKMYSQYYPRIEEFYESKIKKMDAWYYWYALADAQIKANLLEKAHSSIEKGFSFNIANQEFTELQKRLEKRKR